MWVFLNAPIFIGSNVFISPSLEMKTDFTNVARMKSYATKLIH